MSERVSGRAYCRGPWKRGLDLCVSLAAVAILSPLFLFLAIVVATMSGTPILYRQERVGFEGRPFSMLKFRTMRDGSDRGLLLTARGDRRVTWIGRFLRATKFDELPQLFNVLKGEMSIVGPRPEVPQYVATYTAEQRKVLEVRPGLTDLATIRFRDEETLLGYLNKEDRETLYVRTVLPRKLTLNLEYIQEAGFGTDLVLMLSTLRVIVWPRRT